MEQDCANSQTFSAIGEKQINLNEDEKEVLKSVRFGVDSSSESKCAPSQTFPRAKERNYRDDCEDNVDCAQTPRGRAFKQTTQRGKRSPTPFARRRVNIYDSDDDDDDIERPTFPGNKSVQLTESQLSNADTGKKNGGGSEENVSDDKGISASESVSTSHDCADKEAEIPTESPRGRERCVSNKVSRRSQTPFNHRGINMDEVDDDDNDDSESNDGSEWSEKTIETGPNSENRSGKSESDGEGVKPNSSSKERNILNEKDGNIVSTVSETKTPADRQNGVCYGVSPKVRDLSTNEEKSCASNSLKPGGSFFNENKHYTTSAPEPSIYFSGETEDLNRRSSKLRISFADGMKLVHDTPSKTNTSLADSQKSGNGKTYKPRISFADNKKNRCSLKQRVSFAEGDSRGDTGSPVTGRRKTKFTVMSSGSASGCLQLAKAATTSTSESSGSDTDLKSSLNISDEDMDAGGVQKNESLEVDRLRGGRRTVSFVEMRRSDSSRSKGSAKGKHNQEFARKGSKTNLSRRGSRGIRWAMQEEEEHGGKGCNTETNDEVIMSDGSKCVRFADCKSEELSKTGQAGQNSGIKVEDENGGNGKHGRGRTMCKTKNRRSQTPFSRYNVNIYESDSEDGVGAMQKSRSTGSGMSDWTLKRKQLDDKRRVVSFDTGTLMIVKREGMCDENEAKVHGQTLPVTQLRGRMRETGMSAKRRSPTPFAKRTVNIYTNGSEDEDSNDDMVRKGDESATNVKKVEALERRENSLNENGKGIVSRGGSLQTVHTLSLFEEEDGYCRAEKGRKGRDEYEVCRTISRLTAIPSMDAEYERCEKGTQTETMGDGGKWNFAKPFANVNVRTNEARPGWVENVLVGVVRGLLGNCG